MSDIIIRRTRSLCPVCLKTVPAALVRSRRTDGGPGYGGVFLTKVCREHGGFRVKVWGDRMDLESWISREDPLEDPPDGGAACDGDCRGCMDRAAGNQDPAHGQTHGQDSCCVILEVTKNCNLRCTYCFARGGETCETPSYEELCAAIDVVAEKGGGPLIQLTGGEPTLRDDLPDLVRYARGAGCRYTQINTNGIRLAEDEEYVRKLAEAGLDIVFLQFDGTDDGIYRKLRGRDLLETKLRAVSNCDKYRIGVTLVPTVVRGVNDRELGNIVRKASELFPAVRAVHFQPVTYLGRYPGKIDLDTGDACGAPGTDGTPGKDGRSGTSGGRYTLDELMADLCEQTGIPENSLLPSRCDHAMCEFHSTFLVNNKRQLIPLTDRLQDVRRGRTDAARNRQYVAEHWGRRKSSSSPDGEYAGLQAPDPELPLVNLERERLDFDEFVRRMKTHTLKISAMAFQDAMNIDLERLYRCSLHVYEDGRLLPFCAKYMTSAN